ncbi:MAG: hypothetical protein LWY06_05350 [Firmicutes bacterium]|nr:hypothetical protein [Bacillota bacterium]
MPLKTRPRGLKTIAVIWFRTIVLIFVALLFAYIRIYDYFKYDPFSTPKTPPESRRFIVTDFNRSIDEFSNIRIEGDILYFLGVVKKPSLFYSRPLCYDLMKYYCCRYNLKTGEFFHKEVPFPELRGFDLPIYFTDRILIKNPSQLLVLSKDSFEFIAERQYKDGIIWNTLKVYHNKNTGKYAYSIFYYEDTKYERTDYLDENLKPVNEKALAGFVELTYNPESLTQAESSYLNGKGFITKDAVISKDYVVIELNAVTLLIFDRKQLDQACSVR